MFPARLIWLASKTSGTTPKVCNFDETPQEKYGNKLWEWQAHWQYNTERIALAIADPRGGNSCILKDEQEHGLNVKVAEKIASGACKHLNLVQVDDVCDAGPEIFEALRVLENISGHQPFERQTNRPREEFWQESYLPNLFESWLHRSQS